MRLYTSAIFSTLGTENYNQQTTPLYNSKQTPNRHSSDSALGVSYVPE